MAETAKILDVLDRTPSIKNFFLQLSAPFTHIAGQHADFSTLTLTRELPMRPSDFGRRIDAAMVAGVAGRLPSAPRHVFI